MENFIPKTICWHEGMPLLPHHFQQLTLRYELLNALYFVLNKEYNYGIVDMIIDVSELNKNIFKVRNLFCVFQNGILFKSDDKESSNFVYNLPVATDYNSQKFEIYLAIPRINGTNFAFGKNPVYKESESSEIIDINSNLNPENISVLVPNAFLISREEIRQNMYFLKLAELNASNGIWNLNDYTPPSLIITNNSKIYEKCVYFAMKIRSKINFLSRQIALKYNYSQITEQHLFIMALSSNLTKLEALFSLSKIEPFQLYLTLSQYLGQISILTENLIPNIIIKYDHDEINVCIDNLIKSILKIVESSVSESYYTIKFELKNDIFFLSFVDNEISFFENNKIIIGIKRFSNTDEHECNKWIMNAIICNSEDVDLIVRKRSIGYLRNIYKGSYDIIPSKGISLYEINIDPERGGKINDICILNLEKKSYFPESIYLYNKSLKIEE